MITNDCEPTFNIYIYNIMTNYIHLYCEPFIDWFIFHFQVVVFQPLIGAWHHRGRPRPGALEKLYHGNVIKIHWKLMGKCTHIIQHPSRSHGLSSSLLMIKSPVWWGRSPLMIIWYADLCKFCKEEPLHIMMWGLYGIKIVVWTLSPQDSRIWMHKRWLKAMQVAEKCFPPPFMDHYTMHEVANN